MQPGPSNRHFGRAAPRKCAWLRLCWFVALTVALCVLVVGRGVWALPKPSKPRVVVLHSYHHGFSWSDSISAGIAEALDNQPEDVELVFEFMDTRRVHSDEYLDELRDLFGIKYGEQRPDVLICSDDHALNFYLGRGREVFAETPAAFCSVSGYSPSMREGRELTGLVESIDIKSTLDVALRLHRGTRQIAVVSDMTRTGRALKAKAEAVFAAYRPALRFRYLEDLTIDDMKSEVARFGPDTIIFLFIFSRDKAGRVFSHEHNLEILHRHARVPIYAVWDFYLGHGIVGGKLTSGRLEGRMVGELALRILRGEKASQIPLGQSPTQYAFDHVQLRRHRIDESLLPPDSRVVNRPPSLYDEHRGLIWTIGTVLVVLSLAVLFLTTYIVMRRRSQQALRLSEERFRTIFDRSIYGIVLVDRDTDQLVQGNATLAQMLRCSPDELRGRALADLLSPESFHEVCGHAGSPPAGQSAVVSDLPVTRKDGSSFFADIACASIVVDGKAHVMVFFRDVSDRRRAQDALAESEERLRLALRGSELGTWDWNVQTGEVIFNERWAQMLGYCLEELEPSLKTWEDLVHPDDMPQVQKILDDHLAGKTETYETEHRLRTKEGKWKWVLDRGKVVKRDAVGKPVRATGTHLDITERKAAEAERAAFQDQLQQSQKLESLGVLAGGIAHDFNNLLSGVLGGTELAIMDLDPGHPAYANLQMVRETGQRSAELCQQLLAYSGKGRFVVEPVDLSSLVRGMVHLLEVAISKNTLLRYELQSGLPLVEGDATQIRQIVMNLIVNASEALNEEPGHVTLTTGVMDCDGAYLQTAHISDALPAGRYVFLEVSDSGCGMDEQTKARLFDPFFTTKFTGRGLGLAAALGIIRGHRGTIKVYSEFGKGTTFKVLLPVSESGRSASSQPPARDSWSGSGLVLVVDDEKAVRKIASAMVKRLGFDVLLANDGQSGVEAFRQHADAVVLVLLDMTMPGLSGSEVFREIRQIKPDARVILASGYNEQDATARFAGKGLAGFLQKPFQMETLKKAIRAAVEETG